MLQRLRHILEMIRFSHTLFALPFALLAAVMAWALGAPGDQPVGFHWKQLLGVLLCMVFARSAAMAFNRIADRRIDAENPRTQSRHIPAGLLSVGAVVLFAMVCSFGFVASTVLFFPNRLPLYLSAPVLAFLLGYSYTKRFTSLAHFWLGAALALAPLATWIAIRGQIVLDSPADLWPPVILGVAVLLWVSGFDMIYACQDAEYDTEVGLNSVPVRLGVSGALRLAALCHAGMIVALAILPLVYPPFGAVYWIGIGVVALLLVYEHSLVRPDDLDRVNLAFFHVNTVVSLGLFCLGCLDIWL